MSQVSEIIFNWTPETSGRVATIQIQSRIVGTSEWTEQAAAFDPTIGEFRFSSNAPATDVEVRARYRNTDGLFGPWFSDHLVTAPAVVEYGEVDGAPKNVKDGADKTSENTSKDTAAVGGIPAATIVGAIKDGSGNVVGVQALKDATAAAQADATKARNEAAQVRTDLAPSVLQAQSDASTAKTDAATARSDLAKEVAAARGAEDALSTRITTAQTTATGAATAITTETTQRTNADAALANRAATLESKQGSNGAINLNPMFASYTNATGVPDGWGGDDQTNGGASRVAGETGGYALQTASTAAKSCYSCTALPPIPANTWWVVEADVKLTAGTFAGSGILFRNGTQDFNISFVTEKDTTDTVVGAGTVGQTYRFRKLVQTTVAAASPVLYYMTHYSAFGAISAANTLVWYRCAVRPASNAEILAQKADTALNTPTSGVLARLTTEETTRASQNTAVANRATALETTVNNASTGVAATNTKISDEATARSNADTALGNRTSTLESTVNNATTGVAATNARIATEETTRANADTAIANRTSTLETRAGNTSNYTSANAAFTAWPDGAATPSQWGVWTGGTFTREASSFTSGAYMVGHVVPNTADTGLYTNLYIAPGYWVLEASVYCSAGTFQGAGLYVDDLPFLNFSTAPDTSQYVGVGNPGVRNFSLMVQATAGGYKNLYAMGNWSSFGTTTAKTLHWLKAGVRPATDGEIKAQKADVALNTPSTGLIARIGTEETTRANADTALSNRTGTLESTVNNGTTGVAATNARIATEETTRANAVSAVANRTNTLETRFGNATSFTSANPTFAAWQDGAAYPAQWSAWNSGSVSREGSSFTSGAYMVYHNLGATDGGICTSFYVTPGYWVYEASVWCSTGTLQGAGLYADNLPGLNFATAADSNGTIGAGGTGIRNWSYMVQSTYGGQVNLYAMTNWGGFAPVTGKIVHWLKAGIRPASSAEILAMKADATLNNSGGIVARMGNEETARANGDSALSNRTSSLETGFTKLNGNPNMLSPINDWAGIATYLANPYWGPCIQWGGSQGDFEQLFASSPRVPLAGGMTYTLSCDLLATGGASVYATMDVICYDAGGNMVLDGPNTNSVTNADYSDARGIGAIAVTFTAPSNTSFGIVRLLGNARNVARADIGARKIKLERSSYATAYSNDQAVTTVNASIKDEATTRSNNDGALSNRIGSLEASVYTGGTGLIARMSTEENARASADNALASRTNTLEASVAGGNLLTSSNFNSGSSGWGAAYTNASFSAGINIAGDDWHPTNESALSFNQNNADGGQYGYWFSDLIPVNQGQWYQVSCYVASHRADSGIGYEMWNYNGSTITASAQPVRISRGANANGGKDLNSWDRVYFNVQAAGPLMKAQLWKWGTNAGNGVNDSYAWFVRPQICAVANGNAPYVPYSPASGAAQLANTTARVVTSEAAISNLNGRASAYWQVQTVAGNNRAQLTVRADANGGGGVDIVGDVNFSGNLNIGADSGGNRTKITNQNYQVFDGNGVRRVALGLGF